MNTAVAEEKKGESLSAPSFKRRFQQTPRDSLEMRHPKDVPGKPKIHEDSPAVKLKIERFLRDFKEFLLDDTRSFGEGPSWSYKRWHAAKALFDFLRRTRIVRGKSNVIIVNVADFCRGREIGYTFFMEVVAFLDKHGYIRQMRRTNFHEIAMHQDLAGVTFRASRYQRDEGSVDWLQSLEIV